MNCPKTNVYPKHNDIGDPGIIRGAIGPKPWHPVFTTHVDTLILTTNDKPKYHSQAIND